MTAPHDDRRLEQLVDVIVQLASGDLTARLPPSGARDTIDAVITGINLLAGELQDVHADLEQRVVERTGQLEQARSELERLALCDPLTGLANRNLLAERLTEAIARSQQGAEPPSVMLIDLDQFKNINDSLGHGAGDSALIEVARRLTGLTRPGITIARLGGDEFAVLIPDRQPSEALDLAAEVLQALREPFLLAERLVSAGASIGLRLGDREADGEVLLRDADTAMYAAKAEGRGNVQVYRPAMHTAVQERLIVASELAEAIRTDQLFLEYQPIVRIADGSMVGAEALVRWRHPDRGLLHPADFVPTAESSGLIVDLGRWVVLETVAQLDRWRSEIDRCAEFQLHINFSPFELRRAGLDEYVIGVLEKFAVEPFRLLVELSETALMTTSSDGMTTLNRLHDLGVGVAIDDFGTGYSSISYLRRLPIDTVKVDRSLLIGIDADPAQHKFLAAILQLIHSVGLRGVVEGVETLEQLAELRALGCDFGQGFYFGRPMPADQFTCWFADTSNPGT